jgi:hypothetical protein
MSFEAMAISVLATGLCLGILSLPVLAFVWLRGEKPLRVAWGWPIAVLVGVWISSALVHAAAAGFLLGAVAMLLVTNCGIRSKGSRAISRWHRRVRATFRSSCRGWS